MTSMASELAQASPQLKRYIRSLITLLEGEDMLRGLRAVAIRDGCPVEVVLFDLLVTSAEAGHEWLESLGPTERRSAYTEIDQMALRLKQRPERPATTVRKEAYLEAVKDTCDLALAAEATGVSTSLPYVWARTDQAFREKWNEARLFAGLEAFIP